MIDEVATETATTDPRRQAFRRRAWAVGILCAALLAALHFMGLLHGLEQRLSLTIPERPTEALGSIVDVFKCCILSWKALTTMLPAFILGGAIAAFVPTTMILRYLGKQANQARAYAVAAISGVVLSLCSCNIVPLFVSIYRRGAGIGPAFTFLYAGPAINIVAMVFTFQVIGWRLGLWRAVSVPIIAVLVGLTMALTFRKSEDSTDQGGGKGHLLSVENSDDYGRIWALFAILLGMVVYGAWEMAWTPKIVGMLVLAGLATIVAAKRFTREELGEWWRETWSLVKLVVPVLIPAVLIIGAFAAFIDVKLVYRLVGAAPEGSGFLRELQPVILADVFGALMYFPILSEVAFTKAFLKLGMDVGPALAVLLTGAGLSLPGVVIVARAIGWRKVLAYQAVTIAITTIVAAIFGSEIGQYICSCMMLD